MNDLLFHVNNEMNFKIYKNQNLFLKFFNNHSIFQNYLWKKSLPLKTLNQNNTIVRVVLYNIHSYLWDHPSLV